MTDEQEDIEETTHYKNRETLFKFLLKFGVVKVMIEFDGGGDSGQIEDVTCEGLTEDPKALKAEDVINTIRRDWRDGKMIETVEAMNGTRNGKDASLYDMIEAFGYDCLEQAPYDWVNNEGGYGTIEIIPADKSVTCEMNTRETTSHLHILAM